MLTRELIKKIRRIEIITARQAQNQLVGAYQSVFKGMGMAFSEVRPYQPGDDVRRIDWNVTARSGEPHIKLFVEEREMTVMLLVDASASGLFGTREQRKREVAAEIAALLAFSAIKNNDRIGLIIFTDRVEKFMPPKKGKKNVLALVSEILSFVPQSRGTDLAAGLEFLGRVARRQSIAFLLSDFLVEGGPAAFEKPLRIAARRHDLVPVTIHDPFEEELPPMGYVYFEDIESGQVIAFDTSGRGRQQFAELARRQREEREALFRRYKIDFIRVRTDQPYLAPLIQFFRTRTRRMKH